mmetsp:Transcript_15916/g.32285  ORF Transcript_15916/g.32285 Transcript_15916/m.32285 type:complete len:242 (+) Transcript_15916:3693-4418(+)
MDVHPGKPPLRDGVGGNDIGRVVALGKEEGGVGEVTLDFQVLQRDLNVCRNVRVNNCCDGVRGDGHLGTSALEGDGACLLKRGPDAVSFLVGLQDQLCLKRSGGVGNAPDLDRVLDLGRGVYDDDGANGGEDLEGCLVSLFAVHRGDLHEEGGVAAVPGALVADIEGLGLGGLVHGLGAEIHLLRERLGLGGAVDVQFDGDADGLMALSGDLQVSTELSVTSAEEFHSDCSGFSLSEVHCG